MKTIAKSASFVAILALAACGATTTVPDQKSLDVCSKEVGLSQKLVVVTDANGNRTLRVEPEGATLSAQEAIALKNCTDAL